MAAHNGPGPGSAATDHEARKFLGIHDAFSFKPKNDISQDYAIAALRLAALHARMMVNEADTVGIALREGLISPEAALVWARDAGVLHLVGDQDIEAAAAEALEAAP